MADRGLAQRNVRDVKAIMVIGEQCARDVSIAKNRELMHEVV